MSLTENQLQLEHSTPHFSRVYCWFFAACIVLGMAATVVAVLTNPPYYGSQGGVVAAIATNATSSDLMDQAHVISEVIASYLLPLSFLVMAWLAMPRSPWLASIGAVVTLLGTLPIAVFAAEDDLYYDIARMGNHPALVEMAQRFNGDGVMNYYNLMFALSTVLGPVLLGIALGRARVIPRWAATVLALSRLPVLLFMFVPYHFLIIILLVGFLLLFIGSVPVALALLKVPERAIPR
ncbi:MAG TPA: hypothetical protein VKU38_09280 [Ktedonobacteraceae bacterium]|nr:hypothetical protein [Ktedonobacteraceae bacterium]